MAAPAVTYHGDSNIAVRFVDHAKLALRDDIQPHERNLLEKGGDIGLWPVKELPGKIKNFCCDARVVVVASSAFLALADSYLWYASETHEWVRWGITFLPTITWGTARLIGYLSSEELIGAFSLRALGRVTNRPLMNAFYHGPEHTE